MLLTGLITLLIAIPLYSLSITSLHFSRITAILLLYSARLSYNGLHVLQLEQGYGLYSGLFNVRAVRESLEMFLYIVGAIILTQGYNLKEVLVSSVLVEVKNSALVSDRRSSHNTGKLITDITDTGINEYPLIILFTTLGGSFLICSGDMVSMYLSIELQRFAVYILAAIYRNSESATRAGLKYFLLGALSSALILLGSRLIYAYLGLTNFDMLYTILSIERIANSNEESSFLLSPVYGVEVLGILIIAIGLLFKVAAAPLHHWAPDVYDGVPTVVTRWLTIMPKISLFIFLLFLSSKTIRLDNGLKELFLLTSVFSLIIGRVVGLGQSRIKRLLAYSTISHVGFLLLALSVYSEESIFAFLFYLVQYSITNLNIFMILLGFGFIISNSQNYQKKGENKANKDITFISTLIGQFQQNPILSLSFALSLFSMAGIPPLLGFFAKYFVLYSAVQNGYYFISLIAILTRVISARYYLRIIRVIHTESSNSKDTIIPSYPRNGDITSPHMGDRSRIPNILRIGGEKKDKLRIIENSTENYSIGSVHRYIIRILTLFILLYMFNPSLLLNSNNLLAFTYFSR